MADQPCGFLVLDKAAGLTSHACVARAKSFYKAAIRHFVEPHKEFLQYRFLRPGDCRWGLLPDDALNRRQQEEQPKQVFAG